jgi:pimeloyl-ACP methyl ester carboxylesterase
MQGLDLRGLHDNVKASPEAKGMGADVDRLLRRAVDAQLRKLGLTFASERAFVADNLDFRQAFFADILDSGQGTQRGLSWYCNLDVIQAKEHHIMDFPVYPELVPYASRALLIGGTLSSRLTDPQNLLEAKRWLPLSNIEIIEKGTHFLHRTHSTEVIKLILKYAAEAFNEAK